MVQKNKVVLVEDHAPFRSLIRSLLEKQDDWELIGEAGDGLAGVHMCLELQPDLVLLDIGLPSLNGIQAARRIRRHIPACRIVFLTQVMSTQMVEEALGLGAVAYVIKAHTASDLVPAMIAARDGRYFVTADVDPRKHTNNGKLAPDLSSSGKQTLQPAPCEAAHEMHVYPDHPSLESDLASFIKKSLKAGKSVLCLMAPRHRSGIMECLQAQGVDAQAAMAAGRFVPADVGELLPRFMIDGRVDRERLLAVATKLVESLKLNSGAGICSCGEVAPTLWAQGDGEAAVEVERIWNELGKRYAMDTYCTYVADEALCARDPHCYQQLCSVHSHVALH